MTTLREVREKIQGPRRRVDTWYGRNVMRRFSIYLTWILVRVGCTPNQATFLSLVASLIGCGLFAAGHVGYGILFLNLWYLIDHVDGEIARYTGKSSLTGYYFDTILNFIIQPAALVSMAASPSLRDIPGLLTAGILGGYGYSMLMAVPMCQDAITPASARQAQTGNSPVSPAARPAVNRAFGLLHTVATFPNFLLTITVFYFLDLLAFGAAGRLLAAALFFFSAAANFIWVVQLSYKILKKKPDQI